MDSVPIRVGQRIFLLGEGIRLPTAEEIRREIEKKVELWSRITLHGSSQSKYFIVVKSTHQNSCKSKSLKSARYPPVSHTITYSYINYL